MDNALGKFIKEFRESKNMTLAEAAGTTMSVSMLSKFEHGQSDISTSHFLGVLRNIKLSLTDLANYLEDIDCLPPFRWQRQFQHMIKSDDDLALIGFYQGYHDSREFGERYFALIANLYVKRRGNQKLCRREIDSIVDYLSSIEIWSEYEFWLFLEGIPFFSEQSLMFLLSSSRDYIGSISHGVLRNDAQNRLSLQLITYYLDHKEPEEALEHIRLIESHLEQESDASFRIYLHFYYGVALIKMDKQELGREMITSALTMAEMLHLKTMIQLFHDDMVSYRVS